MKQPLRFARHLRLIVVAYLMFTSDFTVVAQQTPSALTGRKTISGIVLDIETDQPIVGAGMAQGYDNRIYYEFFGTV